MHLYKASEWQDETKYWHCNDVEELGKGSGVWWHPARMLNMAPSAYVQWVIENYHPDKVTHSDDCAFVGFAWKSQTQMRKFKNYLNAEARKRNFQVC
jgi:hypothetical protein